MTDPLQALLSAGALPKTSFPPTSRYADVDLTALERADGEPPVPYLRRRLVPRPDRFAPLYELVLREGDRRDLLAHAHLGTAELWWRLADANGVVDPRALEEIGRRLVVTLAADVPGSPDA